MPRYFFHLEGSGAIDEEGVELLSDEAAKNEAHLVARDLTRNRKSSWPAVHAIRVENERDEVVHKEPLLEDHLN